MSGAGVEIERLKQAAGQCAAALVEDGMRVGLGSGSTARAFVEALGVRVKSGLRVVAVASSERTAEVARAAGIDIVELDAPLDLAVDGADAIERGTLAAIKGLGGALVRERLVAQAATRFVLIADDSKLYDRLQDSQDGIPVPVEILPFGWKLTRERLFAFGEPKLRQGASGKPFLSDNGNMILDLYGCDLSEPGELAARIKAIAGVVDHGLFVGMASAAVIAGAGGIDKLEVSPRR